MSKNWISSWQWSFSRIRSCVDQWSETTSDQKRKEKQCNAESYVPIVVPGLSNGLSSSSASTSSTSEPQDSMRDGSTPCPAITQSRSKRSWALGDQWRDSEEAKNKKRRHRWSTGKPVAWSAGMVGGIHWWSDGTRSFCTKWRTHKHLSWTASSGTSDESDIGQAQHFYAFPERPKVRSLQEDQIYKGPSQKTHWQIKYLEQKILGDLITAWSSQWGMCESRHNHRYAVVMQDLASQWLQSYPCKTESSEETEKSLQKFLEPTAKPRGTFAYNSLAFDKSLEELSWNHCASNGIAGRAVPRMKERTCAVLCRSTFDEKWWANSMECYCCVRNVQDYLSDGKTPHERRFGQPFSGPKIPVGLVIEYHPSSAKETPPVW